MQPRTPLIRKTATWLLIPFALLILQACGGSTSAPEPATEDPITVESSLPKDGPGVTGEEYSFTFVYDESQVSSNSLGTMAAGDDVIFSWTFGDGTQAGTATVTIDADGKAILEVKHTYTHDGRYGIVLSVEDEDNNVLATTDFIVEIGDVDIADVTLLVCDGNWQAGGAGGYGVTIDRWDISVAPAGSTFDLQFNAFSIPDKFIVEYAGLNKPFETGWRGDSAYDGEPLYPGGIDGPGIGEALGVFTKGAANEFIVTIIGPGAGTAWGYDIRCNP